jgi:hypothetical protein
MVKVLGMRLTRLRHLYASSRCRDQDAMNALVALDMSEGRIFRAF